MAGNDTLTLLPGAGWATVWYWSSPNTIFVDLEAGYALDGYGTRDTLINIRNVSGFGRDGDKGYGSSGDDFFSSGPNWSRKPGAVFIDGRGGKDHASMSYTPRDNFGEVVVRVSADGRKVQSFYANYPNFVYEFKNIEELSFWNNTTQQRTYFDLLALRDFSQAGDQILLRGNTGWQAKDLGSPLTLTYSFMTQVPSQGGEGGVGFTSFTELQKQTIRDLFYVLQSQTGLAFSEVTGDAGQVQWKFLPTENIASIEVIKGASSVMYGSGSLNGIVNIRTATPSTKGKFSTNVFSGFYSKPKRDSAQWFNELQSYSGANAFYAKRYKQLDFTIGLNALNDNGYRLGEFDKRLRTTLKTNYRFKNTPALQAGLDATLMTQQSASFLLWESFDYGYVALDSAQTKTKASIFSIDPHVDFVKSNYKIRYRGRFYGVDNNIEESSAGVDQDNNSINAYNELVGHYFLNKKRGTLAIGTSNNYTLSKSPLYGGNNITAKNIALFTQADLVYKKWSFNGGLRYEYFSMSKNIDDQLIGRLGLAFEATSSTFIRTSFGQGYRYPTIAERYIETSVGLVNIFPNPNLKPEKGYSAELGIKQGFALGAFKGFVDAAYFFTEYDNMVEFNFGQWRAQPIDTNNFLNNVGFTSFNIGKARISGIDVGVTSGITTRKLAWLFMLGYTYSNPIMLAPNQVFATDSSAQKNQYTYNFTGTDSINNPLKYRYNHLAKIDIQVNYLKKLMLGFSLRYNSFMQNIDRVFVTAPINIASPGVDRGRLLNPNGDWVFDLRAGYTYKKVTLTTTVNNIFNTEIMSRPADFRPTRLFLLQLGYKF
jgi:iron complex outermembrane receptor protein